MKTSGALRPAALNVSVTFVLALPPEATEPLVAEALTQPRSDGEAQLEAASVIVQVSGWFGSTAMLLIARLAVSRRPRSCRR